MFTRPWKMTHAALSAAGAELQLLEYECYAFDDEFHVFTRKVRRSVKE